MSQAIPGHLYFSTTPSISSVGAVASLGLPFESAHALAETAAAGLYNLPLPKVRFLILGSNSACLHITT